MTPDEQFRRYQDLQRDVGWTDEDAYQAEYLARRERAERMAAIGQVGGGVAHELRNPLNVIKTSVYYLLNARTPTPEKTAEHLRRIERHVTLADGVITALSNFARMPVPNLVPLSARDCAEEALELNPPPAEVAVARDWPDDLPPALADADQLRIVLANLIRNAREAMPQSGTLTLRTGGNKIQAVRALGVTRRSLYRLIARYRLDAGPDPTPAGELREAE